MGKKVDKDFQRAIKKLFEDLQGSYIARVTIDHGIHVNVEDLKNSPNFKKYFAK